MSAAALSSTVAAAAHGRIPVLDIGPYLAGDAGAAAPLARHAPPERCHREADIATRRHLTDEVRRPHDFSAVE